MIEFNKIVSDTVQEVNALEKQKEQKKKAVPAKSWAAVSEMITELSKETENEPDTPNTQRESEPPATEDELNEVMKNFNF